MNTAANTVAQPIVVHARATPKSGGDFLAWLLLAPMQLGFYMMFLSGVAALVVLALSQLTEFSDDLSEGLRLLESSVDSGGGIASIWVLFLGVTAWLWSREWRALTFEPDRIVVTRRFWHPFEIPLSAAPVITELRGRRLVAAVVLPYFPPRLAHGAFSVRGLYEIRWGNRRACFVPREPRALQQAAAEIAANSAAPARHGVWATVQTLARRYVALPLFIAVGGILLALVFEYANAVKGDGLNYVRSPLLTRLYLAKPRERTQEMLERYLLRAVETGSADTARLVIGAGADVGQADRKVRGLIRFAMENKDAKDPSRGAAVREVIEILIAHGARLDDYRGVLALHAAAKAGNDEFIRLLLRRGATVDSIAADGSTPLLVAARESRPSAVPLLLAAGASARAANDLYLTPLHEAARGGNTDIARALLAAGAKPEAADFMGSMPLHIAAANGRVELARLLLSSGGSAGAADAFGLTPLHAAATMGHVEIVQLLLAHGAAPDPVDAAGRSPLHHSDAAVMKLLLEAGASPNRADKQGDTPLHRAAAAQRGSVIELLVGQRAPVDTRNQEGLTPLAVLASRAWRANVVVHETLEKDIAGTQARIAEKERDLAAAKQERDSEAIEMAEAYLVELRGGLKTKVERRDRVAKERQQLVAAVQRLLEARADPNTRSQSGSTPLHLAARAGNLDIMPLLIERGAAVDARDNEGRTPLATALASPDCFDPVVRFLLEKGAARPTETSCAPRPKSKPGSKK